MRQTHNPKNERIKRTYLIRLKEVDGRSENLLDQVAKAIDRYETYIKFRDFDDFNIEQVKAFGKGQKSEDDRLDRLVAMVERLTVSDR